MVQQILMSPPVTFLVVLAAGSVAYWFLRGLTLRAPLSAGATKPYACGEEQTAMVQPDYAQFFPFAFFFTILHVVALMVTTVPVATLNNVLVAVLYLVGAVVGLLILYRS